MSENKKKIPIKIKLKSPTGETSSVEQKKIEPNKPENKEELSTIRNIESSERTSRPYQGNNQGAEGHSRNYQGNRPYQGNNQGTEGHSRNYQGNRPYQGNNQGAEGHSRNYQGNRPYQGNNQGTEGHSRNYQGNRPYQGNNQGTEGHSRNYQGNRPYQGNNQGTEGHSRNYQGNRPYQGNNQGTEGHSRNYQGNRPYQGNNQGTEGHSRNYQGNRPYQGNNQGTEGHSRNYQGNRPYQGNNQGTEGHSRNYQGKRPYQGNNQGTEGQNRNYQGNRPYQGNNQGGFAGNQNRGGFSRPPQKDSPIPENTKKDFLSTGNKQRTVKSDFKKKKDFSSSYTDKEVSFELHNRKKKAYASPIPLEIDIYDTILVSELAAKMNLKASDLISKLLNLGYIATINDALDAQTAEIIASEYGCTVHIKSYQEELDEILNTLSSTNEESVSRAPVVTIMGHVDHGKTTLLDYIRKAHVASGEAGGITQHIGAYQIDHNGRSITFIDTPGHEAFTAMRSRGASITDIVILVVAADDGIMPQTIEALNHAKAAKVPTIVAMNKIDKESKNLEAIKSQLSEHGLIPEEWGGDTMFIGVSALKGTGVTDLLDAILLNTDIKEYKANPETLAKGIILESKMDKSRGSIATVIIKDGTLKKGDIFVTGASINRVRAMFNYSGEEVEQAAPSTPIEVLGFEDVPEAGDMLYVTPSEKMAKTIVDKRKAIFIAEHAKKITKTDNTLDDLFQKIQEQGKVDFNVIVKADVQGTVEAIKGMLEKLASQIEEVNLKVIHAAVGAITENDILLASTSGSLVVGFNVRVNNDKTNRLAKEKAVEIRRYSIIYEITNDIKNAIEGILKPVQSEKILGEATVRQVFKIPKIGLIAGSYVTEGMIKMNAQVRVIRDGIVEFTGKISTLKRFKEDIKEATKGFECGIEIANFKLIKEGDILECFEIEHTSKKLELVDIPK